MSTHTPPPRSGRAPALPLLVVLCAATLAGCIDTGPPEWWDHQENIEAGTGLTRPREGQACTAEQREPPADSLRLHFIDVGQGDAIWIQTPTGENILVDAGDGGFFGRTSGGPIVERYLTAHGLPVGATLDAAIVSHAHSDHYGGFQHLFSRYGFARYVDPGLDSTASSYGNLLGTARARVETFNRPAVSAEVGLVDAVGQSTDLFGAAVEAWLLHASSSTRQAESDNARVNNTSIVLRLSYAGRHVLLTGDIHEEIEAELRQRFFGMEPGLSAHILKVAHHGSATSSTILEAIFRDIPVEDRYAVIQAGRLAFGHEDAQLPDSDTVYRLWSYMAEEHLFSTEAGDAQKSEETAADDDHVLAVIHADGRIDVCYSAL